MVEFDGHCIVGSFFCKILMKRLSSKGFYRFRDGGVIYIWKESKWSGGGWILAPMYFRQMSNLSMQSGTIYGLWSSCGRGWPRLCILLHYQ